MQDERGGAAGAGGERKVRHTHTATLASCRSVSRRLPSCDARSPDECPRRACMCCEQAPSRFNERSPLLEHDEESGGEGTQQQQQQQRRGGGSYTGSGQSSGGSSRAGAGAGAGATDASAQTVAALAGGGSSDSRTLHLNSPPPRNQHPVDEHERIAAAIAADEAFARRLAAEDEILYAGGRGERRSATRSEARKRDASTNVKGAAQRRATQCRHSLLLLLCSCMRREGVGGGGAIRIPGGVAGAGRDQRAAVRGAVMGELLTQRRFTLISFWVLFFLNVPQIAIITLFSIREAHKFNSCDRVRRQRTAATRTHEHKGAPAGRRSKKAQKAHLESSPSFLV